MTRPLVFATRNRGKLVELRDLLTGIEVIDVDDAARRIGHAIAEVVEDADTFEGNAIKKAREVSRATGLPALADDSGLEVDALGGAPGVHSARYAGDTEANNHELASSLNNTKLLAALDGITDRTARFRAVLALADVTGPLGDDVITAAGVCEGSILTAPRGTGGFGYDPLFLVAGTDQTMAELERTAKGAISHRGQAMRLIEPRLRAYLR
ncbi:MAG TPA: RdgB/HAM1 family non-canonical purine NTP pyrophosphatase [Kofleriaceae bacterium]|nr:RdgB/HAM1 family non-canonical purine NTP pyrophosphatase [Kofleriaceae bacterium]